MEQPILDGLIEYQTTGCYPWHMPGHKRRLNTIFPELVNNPFSIDVTEVSNLDEFHDPQGIIQDAFDRAADIYGSHKSYYLVNGSSCGLLAAISAVCKKGDSLLVARNSHKSVYNAMRLLQVNPVYILPEWNAELGMFGGVSTEQVKKLLKQHPNVKGILIVSPTYEGVVSDVEKLAKIAHKSRIPLIVDAAHGAHFEFMSNVNETLSTTNYKKVPAPAIRQGADLVVESLHKTLPAMTQCAILHENSSLVDLERLEEFLSIYQSTSPSYVFMASMEACIEKMNHERDGLFIIYKELLAEYRKKFEQLSHIHLVREEDFKRECAAGYDGGKLVFSVKNCSIQRGDSRVALTGAMLSKMLEEEYGQMMEMAGGDYIIAMTSVADSPESFAALYEAMEAIDGQLSEWEDLSDNIVYSRVPQHFIDMTKARDLPGNKVLLTDAPGRVSRDYIFAYPPGVPIITPGEVFTGEIVNEICKALDKGLNIKGVRLDEKGNRIVQVTAVGAQGEKKRSKIKERLWHMKDRK
ncbi:MAG: aminotransferase class I/II-fold pyridoxal phosphate-dependent enzyme [Eubacteriales bacterium]|nr:aminotransferase class I/II-fold pyridoxal phosphate-dependent enzyme [Eubacteriales bacterium]